MSETSETTLSEAAQAALAAEIKADPSARGFLAVESDDLAWNVFNMLRDPAAGRLKALDVDENAMTIDDVRTALAAALQPEGA